MCGGYPETVFRSLTPRRAEWGRQYINAIIQSDVPDRAEIEKLDFLPGFLRALAQEVWLLFRTTINTPKPRLAILAGLSSSAGPEFQPVPARDVLTLGSLPGTGSSGGHLI